MGSSGLPTELREQIWSFCGPSQLASLCLTNKTYAAEAEISLYRSVSLYSTHPEIFVRCTRTLRSNQKKARLVRSLAVIFPRRGPKLSKIIDNGRYTDDSLMYHFLKVLLRVRSLTFLAFRPRWDCQLAHSRAVEDVLKKKRFALRGLYVGSVQDYPTLIQYQNHLQVIGLFDQNAVDNSKSFSPIEKGLDVKKVDMPMVFMMERRNPLSLHMQHITIGGNTSLFQLKDLPVFLDNSFATDSQMRRDLNINSEFLREITFVVEDLAQESLIDVRRLVEEILTLFPNVSAINLAVETCLPRVSFPEIGYIFVLLPNLQHFAIGPVGSVGLNLPARDIYLTPERKLRNFMELISLAEESGSDSLCAIGYMGMESYKDEGTGIWEMPDGDTCIITV